SEFLKGLWDDGTIDKLNDIWLGPDESRKIIRDYSNLPAANGTIRLAVDSSMPPLAYVRDNRVVGYDIDLAVRFCEAKGYGLKITNGSVPAILAEVMSGKSDFTMSLMYTEERAENALFPKTPSGHSGNVVVVLKAKPVQALGRYNSIQELSGKKIGVMTGTTNERLVAENIPTATREYFNTLPDALLALKTGKIDAICCSIYAARYMTIENDDITYLENMLAELDLMPIFSPTEKGRKLRDEYSEFLKGLWDDGTINEIDSIWLGKDDTKRVIKDYSKLPAPNGILRMAAEPTDIPFVYMKDNQFIGYDVDIAVRFCEKYGYGLEVVPMSFSAVISSVNSGKTDFSASMHWNQERAQSALFASVPTAHSGNVIVVMKGKPEAYEGEYSSFKELAGKNIGAMTGTPNGDFAQKAIPTATIQYFDDFADIVTALKMRKIDAASLALNAARFMLIYNEDLTAMGKPLAELDAAPIFAKTDKGRKLCEQFNKFIKEQWDNGTLQELDSIWFGRDESKRTPKDYTNLPAPNGVLKMAVDTTLAPFAYVKDNKIAGYEIDCAVKFCQEHGYGLEVIPMNFGAIIAAVQSGKCDFASCTIAITPERAEQVLFASPNAKTGSVLVVRKAKTQPVTVQPKTETPSPAIPIQAAPVLTAPSQPSVFAEKFSAFMEDARVFFEELKASFNRTFIREERWRLFIEGIINTMIITVLSILFGTVLGFVVYLFCRGGNVFANLLTRF
ncbi:MAG: transporter substrate-binding domain-containing protein, partial [Synergistaceae bacterium]|nr:transporter substrate-binding domain-containing protein [Synergistaceae bacterium]